MKQRIRSQFGAQPKQKVNIFDYKVDGCMRQQGQKKKEENWKRCAAQQILWQSLANEIPLRGSPAQFTIPKWQCIFNSHPEPDAALN